MNCAPEVRVTGAPPFGLMIPRLTVANVACSPKAIREPSGDQTGSLPVAPATSVGNAGRRRPWWRYVPGRRRRSCHCRATSSDARRVR